MQCKRSGERLLETSRTISEHFEEIMDPLWTFWEHLRIYIKNFVWVLLRLGNLVFVLCLDASFPEFEWIPFVCASFCKWLLLGPARQAPCNNGWVCVNFFLCVIEHSQFNQFMVSWHRFCKCMSMPRAVFGSWVALMGLEVRAHTVLETKAVCTVWSRGLFSLSLCLGEIQ